MEPMEQKIKRFLQNVKVLALNCLQWGDTGKGKIASIFSPWAQIIARGVGADNAGHTYYHNGQEFISHILPCGIIHDAEGKVNIIGRGTAVYPKALHQELESLRSQNMTYNNLKVSLMAKLTLPTHIVLDRLREFMKTNGNGRIGTTGKGVCPVYTDHIARLGLIVNDLINPNVFRKKLINHLADKRNLLQGTDPEILKEIMQCEHLENGIYFHPQDIFDGDAIMEKYLEYGREFQPLIQDTDTYIQSRLGRDNILLEGAHGFLLSIEYGTYPYATSSECSLDGLARGAGLDTSMVDMSLGIIKGFYETRVGNGSFPTELGGHLSDERCNGGKITRQDEIKQYSNLSLNNNNFGNLGADFYQGIALRLAGGEYGATTGRPRRTGWLDLPLLRYAWRASKSNLHSRSSLVMTKLDVLNQLERIPVCTHYIYLGPDYYFGNLHLKSGDEIWEAIPLPEVLQHCQPVYKVFDGWQSALTVTDWPQLPKPLRQLIEEIRLAEDIPVNLLSIGKESESTIFL